MAYGGWHMTGCRRARMGGLCEAWQGIWNNVMVFWP